MQVFRLIHYQISHGNDRAGVQVDGTKVRIRGERGRKWRGGRRDGRGQAEGKRESKEREEEMRKGKFR